MSFCYCKILLRKLFSGFFDNQRKWNTDKCHLPLSKSEETQINDYLTENSTSNKLLGVTLDNKVSFAEHVKSSCKKLNSKMDFGKRKLLLNVFFNAQFNYNPLIWMFNGCCNNNKIKYLHERCRRFIYNDKRSSLLNDKLLQKDGSVSIRHKNSQELAIEMFEVKIALTV